MNQLAHPTSSLSAIRQVIAHCQDAIRWACILEATAPKAGNVHPSRSFPDLRFAHFVASADAIAGPLADESNPLGARVLEAVTRTREATQTNVNLGIVLLLAPLVATDDIDPKHPPSISLPLIRRGEWRPRIARCLDALTTDDGRHVYQAIRVADAGGLSNPKGPTSGEPDAKTEPDVTSELDVTTTEGPVDLVVAMRMAAHRDRIALQYASAFRDLFDEVVPVLESSIESCGDLLAGIADAHVRLLAKSADSLIVRKYGAETGEKVAQWASEVVRNELAPSAFDERLRQRNQRLNPGTTADLMAAALYVLLRSQP